MKTFFLIVFTFSLLNVRKLPAQVLIDIGHRQTEKGSQVEVLRITSQYYIPAGGIPTVDAGRILDMEGKIGKQYPEATLLMSCTKYKYGRNCHDYAWGPYMSCMCSAAGDQKEAWVMQNLDMSIRNYGVHLNWQDTSMKNIVTSVGIAPGGDYLFRTGQVAPLVAPFFGSPYYDTFGNPIHLPACPINDPDNVGREEPTHSAVLVGTAFAVPLLPEFSVGIWQSKWGAYGLYRHRWGLGFMDPGNAPNPSTTKLRIYAPKPPWTFGSPPYFVIHSPWGF